ncbi:MAG: hypothetical protein ACN2B6_12630 [Rickettsiales bacterium]
MGNGLKLVLALATLAMIGLGVYVGKQSYDLYIELYGEYLEESACVARLIAAEVERRDIETGDGKCWVKELNHD